MIGRFCDDQLLLFYYALQRESMRIFEVLELEMDLWMVLPLLKDNFKFLGYIEMTTRKYEELTMFECHC